VFDGHDHSYERSIAVDDFQDATPEGSTEFAMLRRLVEISGRPLSFTLLDISLYPGRWKTLLEEVTRANRDGLPIKGQVARLIRVSFGPFQLGELAEGEVAEVPTRVLRDQLGERLARAAGADFSAPVVQRKPEPPTRSAPLPPRAKHSGGERSPAVAKAMAGLHARPPKRSEGGSEVGKAKPERRAAAEKKQFRRPSRGEGRRDSFDDRDKARAAAPRTPSRKPGRNRPKGR